MPTCGVAEACYERNVESHKLIYQPFIWNILSSIIVKNALVSNWLISDPPHLNPLPVGEREG